MAKRTKNLWTRLHRWGRPSRAMMNAMRFFRAMMLMAVVAVCLVSCRTVTTTQQENTSHVFEADTLAKEAKHDTHVSQQSVDIDSIVTAVMQHVKDEFNRQEQEHETVTETLTETIDSLGNIIRQTQKTTDRTTSKQEQRRTERLEQTVRQEIHEAMARQDSLWQERFSEYQASVRDSLQQSVAKQKTASSQQPLSWWAKAWTWLRGILLGIVIGIVIVFIKNVRTRH